MARRQYKKVIGRRPPRSSGRREPNPDQNSPPTPRQTPQQKSEPCRKGPKYNPREEFAPTQQCQLLQLLPLEIRCVIYDAVIRLAHTITISEKDEFHFHNQSILTPMAQTCSQVNTELHGWLLEIPKEKMLAQGIVNSKRTCSFGPFNRNTTTFLMRIGDFPAREVDPGLSNERLMRLLSLMRLLRGLGGAALKMLVEGGIGRSFALA